MTAKVLIIEDDDILRDIYTLKFELEGFIVRSAADGKLGLEKVAQDIPDLIILDMLMPHMGGIEFLRNFREDYKNSTTKIIVASNMSSADLITEARQLCVCDYIIKSQFTPEDIVLQARKQLSL
jgi:DNA-binding response OmpR family regulator